MKYRVEFFQPKEFRCNCCGLGMPSAMLVYHLDILRRVWGLPIRINSGFRCVRHNQEVGGAKSSRHLLGCAADVAPHDAKLIGPFQTLCGDLFGRREEWELKLYPTFVHVAVPREEQSKLWNGGIVDVRAA